MTLPLNKRVTFICEECTMDVREIGETLEECDECSIRMCETCFAEHDCPETDDDNA